MDFVQFIMFMLVYRGITSLLGYGIRKMIVKLEKIKKDLEDKE